MPIIRGQARKSTITEEQRRAVAEQLAKELAGETTEHGPVIFEIPLEQEGRIDVLVVWEAWQPFSSTERSATTLAQSGTPSAYCGSRIRTASVY